MADVNIGANSNDGTGDPLRTAFNRLNMNDRAFDNKLSRLSNVDNTSDKLKPLSDEAIDANNDLLSDMQALEVRMQASFVGLPVVQFTMQLSPNLPLRPLGASIVHWYTWSDPTSLMTGADLWFELPAPVAPIAPSLTNYDFLDARDGVNGVLRIYEIPAEAPPLLSIQYSVDSGSFKNVPGMAAGDHILTGIAPATTHTLSLRHRNYISNGPVSTKSGVKFKTGNLVDHLTINGKLSDSSNWVDITRDSQGRSLNVDGGAAKVPSINTDYFTQSTQYYSDNQFVELTIAGAGANTGSDKGVSLFVRMGLRQLTGYQLLISNTKWFLFRVSIAGRVTIGNGSISSTLDRVKLQVVGSLITGHLNNGSPFFSITDTAFTGGVVGVGINAAGADGIGAVQFTKFVGGNI